MKRKLISVLAVMAACVVSTPAQPLPGPPELNGMIPKTATFYVDGTNSINNGGGGTVGIGIAANGNVMLGFEDDGNGITDLQGVWTMFDSNGNWITPNTKQDSLLSGGTLSLTNKYLSFFRPDGSATPGYTAWAPKVHANLFGNGLGFGGSANAAQLEAEVSTYASWSPSLGNFPVVQLFNNSGAPQSDILSGVTQAYATADIPDDIRIADWEYLSNGNIVIVGLSSHFADLVNLYGGPAGQNHVIYRILTPAGAVVKSESLVSVLDPYGWTIAWHGVGATANGFAVRFADFLTANWPQTSTVRMFDNNGNPTTGNLRLGPLTGHPQVDDGNYERGDSTGFHGNGKDAYVYANPYNNVNGRNGFWVTVLNTNGTVRWSRDVSDDLTLGAADRGDAAIDEFGQVIVVYSAQPGVTYPTSVTMGRRFDASGNPQGGTFYVSEKEVPDWGNPPYQAGNPRVAWRNGTAVIGWESANYPDLPYPTGVVAERFFLPTPTLFTSASGSSVTISWPTYVTGFTLESSPSLSPASWTAVSGVVNNSVTVVNPSGKRFYRLKK